MDSDTGKCANVKAACSEPSQIERLVSDIFLHIQELLDIGQRGSALGRQYGARFGTNQQRNAEIGFQSADKMTDAGLSISQFVGSPGDAVMFCCGHKGMVFTHGHAVSPLLFLIVQNP